MRPLRLYINVDHVATVRQARQTDEPDPLAAAHAAEAAGADGITIHLREDRRHVQDQDVVAIVRGIETVCNLELAVRDDIIAMACELRPFQATIVPERREEVTTEGGLTVDPADQKLAAAVQRLGAAGIHVSLFIDPDLATIDAAHALGVPAVELHTGRYAHAWRTDRAALSGLEKAADHAAARGLAVHAGHGLTYENVTAVARIAAIEELNIGHTIISRAILTGIGPAVSEMKALVEAARR
jgi:pyridoxine 5-phosphate synthase